MERTDVLRESLSGIIRKAVVMKSGAAAYGALCAAVTAHADAPAAAAVSPEDDEQAAAATNKPVLTSPETAAAMRTAFALETQHMIARWRKSGNVDLGDLDALLGLAFASVGEVPATSSTAAEDEDDKDEEGSSKAPTMPSLMPKQLPFELAEVAIMAVTVDKCAQVWDMIERRKEILRGTAYFGSAANSKAKLSVLRIANGLLRRLSKRRDTDFCGRILMFLAYVSPLGERSAVNVLGRFNVGNVTEFDEDDDDGGYGDATETMELVGAHPPIEALGASATVVNHRLYKHVWTLQQGLANPQAVLTERAVWDRFTASATATVTAFEGLPLGKVAADDSGPDSAAGDGQGSEEARVALMSCLAGKYLTKKSLLQLQLRDPTLRRHVLVQLLVVLQYVLDHKDKKLGRRNMLDLAKLGAPAVLGKIQSRAMALLEATPPRGKVFAKNVRRLLEREKDWVKWKNERKCHTFERESVEQDFDAFDRTDPLSEYKYSQAKSARKQSVGGRKVAQKMMKAFGRPGQRDNQACLAEKARAKDPELSAFLKPMRSAISRGLDGDHSRHPQKNKVYCWRGLRLLTKKHLGKFADIEGSLETAVKLIDGTTPMGVGAPAAAEASAGTPTIEAQAAVKTENGGEDKVAQEEAAAVGAKGTSTSEEASEKATRGTKRKRLMTGTLGA